MGQLYLVSREFLFTLPKTNIAPENGPKPKKESSFPNINFQVRAVSFREGRKIIRISFALSLFCVSFHRRNQPLTIPRDATILVLATLKARIT